MNVISNDLPPRDHNGPPLVDPDLLAQSRQKVEDFAAAGKAWLDLGEITTDEQAQDLADFIAGANKVSKRIDEARVAAKRPYDDAAKGVQALFKPLVDIIDLSVVRVKPLQLAWIKKKQAKIDAEQAEKRRLAEEARIAAENAAARAAVTNDIAGEIEAEALRKQADELEKAGSKDIRAQVQSASGGGRTMSLRVRKEAEIVDINNLFRHYRAHPEVAATLKRLADADIRARDWDGKDIPGTRTIEKETAQ